MAKIWQTFLVILKDYCLNSSLAGLRYIASDGYHFSERIFWFFCIAFSAYGSYNLIKEYQDSFETNAISMVIEELTVSEKLQFPSLGICELGDTRTLYPRLEEIVESLRKSESVEYNGDVEDFLLRIIFQNTYSGGSLSPSCEPWLHCKDECVKCPTTGYQHFAKKVRATCNELFYKCFWQGLEFDCCQHFLPLQTTMGECFVLNSIQTTTKKSPHWLKMEIDFGTVNHELKIILTKAISVNILNEEDVPHLILTSLQFAQPNKGFEGRVVLSIQSVVNDEGVRDVNPKYRRCLLPDENPPDSVYKYFSFSTCVTDCLRNMQMLKCNCTNYNMVTKESDEKYICDYDGYICLDENDILFPQTSIMQPWSSNGIVCPCFPSCTEHEIQVVEKSFEINKNTSNRSITIDIQELPTERYRRQAVRTQLDVVVSIGGILGLFMGASILSGIELIMFIFHAIRNFFIKQ